MTNRVELVLHHGENWRSEVELVYEGGTVTYKNNIDTDYVSLFEIVGYGKELGYKKGARIWYQISRVHGSDEAFEEMIDDQNVKNMFEDYKIDD